MNLLEAKKELKEHGYTVKKLNECGGSIGFGGSCGGYVSIPHYRSSGRRSTNHMKPEELDARRAKIADNEAKLAEFKEKQLPKLAKLFGVDKAYASQSAGVIKACIFLDDKDKFHDIVYITYSKEGIPEYFKFYTGNQEFKGSLNNIKNNINALEEIINVLQTISKIK